MQKARITKPAKTAMQSGIANTKHWELTFDPRNARFIEPLMGWTGSSDTSQQLTLYFDTQAEAEQYAQQRGLNYEVSPPHDAQRQSKAYADNFSYRRVHAFSLPGRRAQPAAQEG